MQMGTKAWGVLIADVIGSSSTPNLRSLLSAKLRIASLAHQELLRLPYAVTAGDEFQTITAQLNGLPWLVFDLRRRLRPLEVRIGIGIGPVPEPLRPPVNELGGLAFQWARQAIEETKSGHAHKFEVHTAFRSANAEFDRVANLVYGLHDTLIRNPTEKQWQAIDAYIAKKRVDLAARALRISVSTASRSLRRGHFWQIEETIATMKKVIEAVFP
jgi:hypothetical protein